MTSMTMAIIGAAFCLFAANLWLIQYAANLTPYWDEWDAGAASLLKPYLEGTLALRSLFEPFNEHIIFFPRLVILFVYQVSGYYDVILQMILNAFALALLAPIFVTHLSRCVDASRRLYLLMAVILISIIPFAWENTLMGLGGTEFLLTAAFSIASLTLIVSAPAWSLKWLAGFFLAIAAFLNAASGILACLAAAFISAVQIFSSRRVGAGEWIGVSFLLVASLVIIKRFVPHIYAHDALRAHSVPEYIFYCLQLASWPLRYPFGIVLFLPIIAIAARTLRQRPPIASIHWLRMSILVWLGLQIFILVYGRGQTAVISSRYTYVLQIGLLLNLVCMVQIIPASLPIRRTLPWGPLVVAAAFGLVLAIVWDFNPGSLEMKWVEQKKIEGELQQKHVTDYLRTKTEQSLADTRDFAVPYPDRRRLSNFLDDHVIRGILPSVLLSKAPSRTFIEIGKSCILGYWFVFAILGGILFQAGCFRLKASGRSSARSAPLQAASNRAS